MGGIGKRHQLLQNFPSYSLSKTKNESPVGTHSTAKAHRSAVPKSHPEKVTARIPALDTICLISSRKPNEIKRHIVHLRRLGTAGAYPFQSSAVTFHIDLRIQFIIFFPQRQSFFQKPLAFWRISVYTEIAVGENRCKSCTSPSP